MSDVSILKIQVPAGSANPGSVGSSLGPKGINIIEFCKIFNDKTKDFEKGTPIPVEIAIQKNKKFTLEIKTPPTSYLILKEVGIEKGSQTPGRSKIAKITTSQIMKIAKIKAPDLNIFSEDVDRACKIIEGSARSAGIEVVNE